MNPNFVDGHPGCVSATDGMSVQQANIILRQLYHFPSPGENTTLDRLTSRLSRSRWQHRHRGHRGVHRRRGGNLR